MLFIAFLMAIIVAYVFGPALLAMLVAKISVEDEDLDLDGLDELDDTDPQP